MSTWTGQPWLAINRLVSDGWSPVGRVFWRDVGPDAKEPNRLHDLVRRIEGLVGGEICRWRGHLYAGDWRFYIKSDKCCRWCVRCGSAEQVGRYVRDNPTLSHPIITITGESGWLVNPE